MELIILFIVVVTFVALFKKISVLTLRIEGMERFLENYTRGKVKDIEVENEGVVDVPKAETNGHVGGMVSVSNFESDRIGVIRREGEWSLVSKGMLLVGVVSVLLGVTFFLKYTFENDIITETGRVMLGFISGVVFIVIADRLKEKIPAYSAAMMGLSFALLYLSVKFGEIYQLYPEAIGFVLMILVTLGAFLMSMKVNSKLVAAVALVGGYLTPVLASSGPNEFVLFNYIAILGVFVLALAYKKDWYLLTVGAFVGTVFLYIWNLAEHYDQSLIGIYLFYLFIYFLLFTIMPFAKYLFAKRGDILNPKKMESLNALVPVFSLGLFLAAGYVFFEDLGNDTWNFIVPAGAVLTYLVISSKIVRLDFTEGVKRSMYYFIALASFSVAMIPVFAFSGLWITTAWVGQALVMVFLSKKMKDVNIAKISLPFWILGLGRLLTVDAYVRAGENLDGQWVSTFEPIFNERFFLFVLTVIAVFVSAHILMSMGQKVKAKIAGVVGNILILIIIFLELETSSGANYISDDTASLMLSLIYLIYSAILMMIGMAKNYIGFRMVSLSIIIFVIAKAYVVDIWEFSELFRIMAFLLLGIFLLILVFYYMKNEERLKESIKNSLKI